MRSIFRSLERSGVEYLLISGQASVLYGAALSSEDLDIWVRPTGPNLRRLLRALARCRARVHKLTPPVTSRFARRGHGFHFWIPGRPLPVYLDVMACPPRVRSFEEARRRARPSRTPWGEVPVVAIEDLVALKRTRRLADYDVISRLVQIRLAEEERPTRRLLRWAARHAFRVEDRLPLLRRLGGRSSDGACRRAISREIAWHQARDSAHWRTRLLEIRRLRRDGRLLPQGMPVSRLLRPPRGS
ncbi:MAG: hypothetical protein L0323_10845 [Planctomycetes bacterium]|nr:hypothetical protein [Planctomycetota bacterium]